MITITVTGTVGRDPMRKGDSVFFSVASNRKKADGSKETTWVDVAVWDNKGRGPVVDTSRVAKGVYVTVTGKGGLKSYTSKSGELRTGISISAESLKVGYDGPPNTRTAKQSLSDEEMSDIPF